MSFLSVASVVTAAAQANPPAAPQDSKGAAQAAGKDPQKKADQATPAPPAGAASSMVFVDPVTRQIVQPTAAQIGTLVNAASATSTVKTPPTLIQGPGNTVGVLLGPDFFAYAVVTRTADGKLAMDCVTGEKAAAEVVAGETRSAKESSQAKASPDVKK